MKIFLIGFMGSGKSTLGKELAEKLNLSYIEADMLIEQQSGMTIPDIFSKEGEAHFRILEKNLLQHLQLADQCVIATGGGMPCHHQNIDTMNRLGMTIWLDVDEEVLVERLENQKAHRPLLFHTADLKTQIHQLLQERQSYYEKAKYKVRNPDLEKVLAILK